MTADDPEAAIAIFNSYPSVKVIEEFRQHVIATGKPDEWRFHARSRPARDEPFEIVLPFDVPESLRSQVPMASCPICSPNSPKYYNGALAWFQRERKVRAIGHECAGSHFGHSKVAAAYRRFSDRRDQEIAFDEVTRLLPQLPLWRSQLDELRSLARSVDDLKAKLWKAGTRSAWAKVAKVGADGFLSITEERRVTSYRPDGSSFERSETATIWRHQIAGLRFLKEGASQEAAVANLLDAIDRFPKNDDNAILTDLPGAKVLLHNVREGIEGLRSRLRETLRFIANSNLLALSRWSQDDRSNSPVIVNFDPLYGAQLSVSPLSKIATTVAIPAALLKPPAYVQPDFWL
jgi:hypothetical protein